jgi:hypothetical protein
MNSHHLCVRFWMLGKSPGPALVLTTGTYESTPACYMYLVLLSNF